MFYSEHMKYHHKKDLCQKTFLLCFVFFKMLHFHPSDGECCSWSEDHVTSPRDVRKLGGDSAVREQRRWLTARTYVSEFVGTFHGRIEAKTSRTNNSETPGRHIVSCVPSKSCNKAEVDEICAETACGLQGPDLRFSGVLDIFRTLV